ncbi:hypothetical protein [Rugosimonospora africana]|nr:hypothetical protein [Rugosimonospora africana]
MFSGLDDVDWSSLHHAYGTAEEVPGLLRAMASPDADARAKAVSRFYSAVHHQGDVTSCTTVTVPFLLELARTPDLPGRAEIVGLLVSIGTHAVESYDDVLVDYSGEESNHALAADLIRERAEDFIAFTTDDDHRLRRAAIPALAQFVDDAPRAAGLVQDRLRREERPMHRLLLVETMAQLTLRLPAALGEATAWFDALADDTDLEPEIRLAALAERALCVPDAINPDLVPTTAALVHRIALNPLPPSVWAGPPRQTTPVTGAPPQIADAFRQLEYHNAVYTPTTDLLRTFHTALGARVADRTALLTAQLDSVDPGSRLRALRMAGDLMRNSRGDHSTLIRRVATQLDDANFEVSAEAADVLSACQAIAEPARDSLAAHISSQTATHGPDVWAAPDRRLRRAHQNAVLALARIGDDRAVPHLLTALDGEVDSWRAVEVAGCLTQAAAEFTPRLCRHLAAADLAAQQPFDTGTRALLTALGRLADPAALPSVLATLDTAVRLKHWSIAADAVRALGALGPSAAPALSMIRALTGCPDGHVRSAALKALSALGVGPDELMPLVLDALSGTTSFWIRDAVDILATIPPAAGSAAVPRLQELLENSYDWTRIFAAAGLWHVAGEVHTQAVLDTLLQAWNNNGATANFVLQVLKVMGSAAAPALPYLVAELANTRRSGRFASIDDDEDLQETARDLIVRLG